MGKVQRTIRSQRDRDLICRWVPRADDMVHVELREPRRSTEQSDKMWAMLTDINRQRPTLHGCKMSTDKWKAVFMMAAGQQVSMLPNLDGDGFFPYGHRSSELSVKEMSDVIEQIYAYAAQEGLSLNDHTEKAA